MEKEKEQNDTSKYFGNNLMNLIIAETFCRHSKLSEQEYLEKLGLDKSGKSEEDALRIAKFNVLIETTRAIFELKEKLRLANEIIKTVVLDGKLTENDKGEEK